MKRLVIAVILAGSVLVATGAVALANHTANNVTIPINSAWGGSGSSVQVTYQISAGRGVAQDVLDTVQDAVDNWNTAIDEREGSWTFDLVSFTGSPPDKPDITIRVKKGGGAVLGRALCRDDRQTGLIINCKITISGRFLIFTDLDQVLITTWQELGHALGLGHADQPEDPMFGEATDDQLVPTSDTVWHCDADAFVAGHHWLTSLEGTAHHPEDDGISSITCT